MSDVLFDSELPDLELIHRGKVRDSYALDAERLLIIATDRLSAFDVILPQGIPQKGAVLTRVANFWFQKMRHLVPNHLVDTPLDTVLTDASHRQRIGDRGIIVKRLKPLPVEAIVRGYLIGSGWKDYQATGQLCGIDLPAGLEQAARLPEPIFTPSSKAQAGHHDENITQADVEELVGKPLADEIRRISLSIYTEAAEYARARGIIIADTKFEFGVDNEGVLHLIDEVLTPDSSRFWPADQYRIGISPPSYDKQFVRDYLETLDWDKTAPGPDLPDHIVNRTAAKYAEAERILTIPATES